MDQTLSEDYCQSVIQTQATKKAEVEAQGGTWVCPEPISSPLLLDSDRLQTAKRRTEYFKNEIMNHAVLDGDGAMDGHMAMATILDMYKAQGRHDLPIVFNLTGNVMEYDRKRYLQSGSSGVLPKPTKLEELTALLQSKLEYFICTKVCVVDDKGFVTTPDGNFCFSHSKQPTDGPHLTATPLFQPSGKGALPLSATNSGNGGATLSAAASNGADAASSSSTDREEAMEE